MSPYSYENKLNQEFSDTFVDKLDHITTLSHMS